MTAQPGTEAKPSGSEVEQVAFQFCKVATVCTLAGRYALPVAAGLCALLYFVTVVQGVRRSRCWLRYPLLIGCVWTIVLVAWLTGHRLGHW